MKTHNPSSPKVQAQTGADTTSTAASTPVPPPSFKHRPDAGATQIRSRIRGEAASPSPNRSHPANILLILLILLILSKKLPHRPDPMKGFQPVVFRGARRRFSGRTAICS